MDDFPFEQPEKMRTEPAIVGDFLYAVGFVDGGSRVVTADKCRIIEGHLVFYRKEFGRILTIASGSWAIVGLHAGDAVIPWPAAIVPEED